MMFYIVQPFPADDYFKYIALGIVMSLSSEYDTTNKDGEPCVERPVTTIKCKILPILSPPLQILFILPVISDHLVEAILTCGRQR